MNLFQVLQKKQKQKKPFFILSIALDVCKKVVHPLTLHDNGNIVATLFQMKTYGSSCSEWPNKCHDGIDRKTGFANTVGQGHREITFALLRNLNNQEVLLTFSSNI